MSDISDRVKKIVVEHLNVEEDKVVDGASFIDVQVFHHDLFHAI